MTSLLQTKSLSKRFDGVEAIKDVNLTLNKGEILGIFGPNGAGKTTLFNVVTGILKPDEGHVMFCNNRIDRLPPHRIPRLGIIRTFQEMRLIKQATVLENLLLFAQNNPGENLLYLFCRPSYCSHAERNATRKALSLLEVIDIADRANDEANDLSYGQQKLLSICCCLMANVQVMLLDEPLAGLAKGMAEIVVSLIQDSVAEGRSAIIIEHNIGLLAHLSHRLIFMDSGRIVWDGLPEETLKRKEVIEAYLR